MYFKLELQPVNHGDYALPCCALSGSGGIPIPEPQLSMAPAGYCISGDQPCCWPGAVNIPRAFPAQQGMFCSPARIPAQVFSIFGCLFCSGWSPFMPMCTCKHTPGHCRAKHPRMVISSPNLWQQQPPGLVLLSHMIFRITVFNFSMLIIIFHTKVDFSLQPGYDLVLNLSDCLFLYTGHSRRKPNPFQFS